MRCGRVILSVMVVVVVGVVVGGRRYEERGARVEVD